MAEEARILEALRLAIQMEIEGKEYYLKASEVSASESGKKLLRQLASEEETHQRRCMEIYEAIRREHVWPQAIFEPIKAPQLTALFSRTSPGFRAQKTEFESIKIAIDMEDKSYDFYKKRESVATGEGERKFYEALVAEEMRHRLALLEYQEYLRDPAGWFVLKERPSLDRG